MNEDERKSREPGLSLPEQPVVGVVQEPQHYESLWSRERRAPTPGGTDRPSYQRWAGSHD